MKQLRKRQQEFKLSDLQLSARKKKSKLKRLLRWLTKQELLLR